MARWLEFLNTYNFEVQHRPGKQHGNADGLSRRPCVDCTYCTRQGQKELESTQNESNEYYKRVQKNLIKNNSDKDDEITCVWFNHKTEEQKAEAQSRDSVLSHLHKLKNEHGEKPTWSEMALENVQLKKYWSQWDRIVLKNGVLNRKWIHSTTEENIMQLIIPNEWKQEILEMLHDDIQSGHLGIHKTTARVQNRFYWLGYKQDVIKHIQNCIVCNSRKQPSRKAKSRMKKYNVNAPLERVALDLIGPLPLYKGNKYALIVTDYFTKWAEGYLLPNIEAQTIADSFTTNFISRFGIPRQIHTDQGRQFESKLFQERCK